MPTTNKLTDHACKAAKPKDKGYKLFDGGGLYLYVTPTGARSWRLAYRVDGTQKTITLGLYPDVSLADARKKRDEERRKLAAGETPGTPKVNKTPLLADAYTDYWKSRHDVTDRYRHDAMVNFKNHVQFELGSKHIGQIGRDDLLPVLLKIDRAGHTEAAKKARTYLSQVWQTAIEHGHCVGNVPQAIQPKRAFSRHAVEHFAALDLPEVPGFWKRLSLEQHRVSGVACKLLALTWVRTTELRGMRWSEIDGDMWRIPAARMKRSKDHLVPLSKQAQAILAKLKPMARGDLIFPSSRGGGKTISENTILFLIYEMGYKDRMTGHGLRSVASTWANENGYPPDAIERQLAHSPDDKVRSAYNRAEFITQRSEMLQAWADWLGD